MNQEFVGRKMPGLSVTGIETNVITAPGSYPVEKNNVPEGSDVFRSVMKEFHNTCDTTSTLSDTDHRYLYESLESDSEDESNAHSCANRQSRKIKMASSLPDRWDNKSDRSCNSPHRVQWADECNEKSSSKEIQCDKNNTRRKSSPKPILKHKVNCVIIVSD